MTLTRLAIALVALSSATARAQQLAVTPYEKTGIYGVGKIVGWTIGVAEGQQAASGAYTYVVKENGQRAIKNGSLDLTRGPAKIETSLNAPGMVRIEIRPPAGAKDFGNVNTGGNGVVVLAAAVDPTKIQPVVQRPADFDEFWKSKLALLARIPINAVVTPKESGNADINYATIRLDNFGGAHVWGQMAWPKREGKFPALVIYQWASSPYPLAKSWVTDRAAEGWLAVNIEPHDVPSDMPQAFYEALPQMIKEYQRINETDRDRNYFLQMYLGDYRALDYVTTLPQWDGKTLAVNGISMGGQQSLVMAALHPKVSAVVVNVPAGSDANAALHGRQPGYPNWDSTNPRVMETARYFDVVNFASRITAPTLVAMGFIDDVTPSIGIWTTFNQIPGVKEAVPMIDSPHNHHATAAQQMPYTTRSAAWLRALLRGEPLPK
ncbi:MAG TPA: acetylxylan esterase [Gemmatimonadaceae bacterium]